MGRKSLKEALEETGLRKGFIAESFSITANHLSTFMKSSEITKPQALMVEKLTGMKIEEIEIKLK